MWWRGYGEASVKCKVGDGEVGEGEGGEEPVVVSWE